MLKKIANWKAHSLSTVKRKTLIQAYTSALPNYLINYQMANEKLPCKNHQGFKLVPEFLPEGIQQYHNMHHVKWKQICMPKLFGRLGILDLICKTKFSISITCPVQLYSLPHLTTF
eukprot:TRINITY_DN2219_c3_g1_i1.p1 TRINITY_DN2219_c3_g1~~TRINITY_DN2219_c3_g1_i1.p1  ORF type:complete len:116 (+),score=12.46 TRINITY_DN2219_c3_g1_i1:134-481(+)